MSADICPTCGEESDECYRCTECGRDLAGETSTEERHG